MTHKLAFILLCFFTLSQLSVAQTLQLDSLKALLSDQTLPDSSKVRVYINLFNNSWKQDISQAYPYAQKAVELAEQLEYPRILADSYHAMGLYYYVKSDYNSGLSYNYKALKIRESIGDRRMMGNSWNNIGIMYSNQGDHDKALEAYNRCLSIRKESNDQQGIGSALGNIGIEHLAKGDKEKALECFNESIEIKKALKDVTGQAYTYEEIANIYRQEGKYSWALENYELAISLLQGSNDNHSLGNMLWNLGTLYTLLGRYDDAKETLSHALSLAKNFGDIRLQRDITLSLSELSEAQQNAPEALSLYKQAITLKDSILNEEQSKSFIEMRTKYETEKKEQESKQRLETETLRRNAAFIGLGMALILLIVFLYSNYQKSKTNKILEEQKAQITEQNLAIKEQNKELGKQKAEIEEKSKQITDSIRYAKDIQFAILPSQRRMRESYSDLFVLNKPRDIVSGDFYWYSRHDEGKAYLAVADCTGHGVPGALMSMVFNDFFDYIINERGWHEVDDILREIHKAVRISLRQEETANTDGMEVGLCAINFQTNTFEFAGAKRPLYYIQNGEMHEIKGDKKPIGGQQKEKERVFTKHQISLDSPLTFYLFSDGYHDQFGGEHRKKMMSSHFKNYLKYIYQEPMERQKELLTQKLHDWMNPIGKGSVEQIDDILVLGAKIG